MLHSGCLLVITEPSYVPAHFLVIQMKAWILAMNQTGHIISHRYRMANLLLLNCLAVPYYNCELGYDIYVESRNRCTCFLHVV